MINDDSFRTRQSAFFGHVMTREKLEYDIKLEGWKGRDAVKDQNNL